MCASPAPSAAIDEACSSHLEEVELGSPPKKNVLPATAENRPTAALIIARITSRDLTAAQCVADTPREELQEIDSHGATIAHWAALQGMVDVLQALHEKGVSLDQSIEGNGMRPLHWACTRAQMTAVRYLHSVGCSIDDPEANGQTPLMLTAQGEFGVLLHWLLPRVHSLTAVDKDGDTALHWAAYKNCRYSASALISYGLKPEDSDNFGATALHLAVGNNSASIVELLLRHDKITEMLSFQDSKGRTPSMLAAERGYTKIQERLQESTPFSQWQLWYDDISRVSTGITFRTVSNVVDWTANSNETVNEWLSKRFSSRAAPITETGLRPAPPA
ncbi:MAG: hypothetical protein SGPRY_000607 [Prymnesium sp.]